MVVPTTQIRVGLANVHRHLIDVCVRTPGLSAGAHEFFMPVWTPGSYLVREYARHVEGVVASDAAGRALPIQKVAKNRWRVELTEDADVVLDYRVYARDLSVRTNHVDERRAYWNGAATYIVAAERRDAPFAISVDVVNDWTAHCALPREGDAWIAQELDEAVDEPFVVSAADVTEFTACGKPHLCILDGVDEEERDALTADLHRIVQAAASIFGDELPYDRYYFYVFADGSGSGGLEHASSTVCHFRRSSLRKPDRRLDVLGLFAHEHFHVWNVKRIRPPGLARFDYEAENYTPDLWLSEGFTTYYQEIVPYRAGVFTREHFLSRLAKNWQQVLSVPGRSVHSVSDASFDAWIKLYRPDENLRNTTVSYYSKGAVLALGLDLLIQAGSNGQRSLDDVMRGLWAHYLEHGPGQPRELVLELCSRAAGRPLDAEFELLVEGREDPPLAEWLAPFGLRFDGPSEAPEATLDAQIDADAFIERVDRGAAGEAMGLSPADELIAIDGERVAPSDWNTVLREQFDPGQVVTLTIARRGLLETLEGALGSQPRGAAKAVEGEGALRFRDER